MISIEQVVALALKDRTVLDQLGEALCNELVVSNPHQRRVVKFADDFLLKRRALPGVGDWEIWLGSLPEGMIRDGAREHLHRIWAIDTAGFDPAYLAEQALQQMRTAAARTARASLNAVPDVTPELLTELANKVNDVRSGAISGLARLSDIDTWARPVREHELIPTGYHTLDRYIGGWGRELWLLFAGSGMGKTILLQNWAASCARKGKRVLHITLELGILPQIHRYYRAIARATRGEFAKDIDAVKGRLQHWFRLAQGEVYLLEATSEGLDPDKLRRIIERVGRSVGDVDVLVLDYLDLMSLPPEVRSQGRYEDLGYLTREVRSFRTEFDLTVLSCTQAIRSPKKPGLLTPRDIGDSYEKFRIADGILTLQRTPEEKEVFQGRIGILKVRDSGGGGILFPVYMNEELAVIAELDHPNTRQLMERLGHLPEQLQKVSTPTGLVEGIK